MLVNYDIEARRKAKMWTEHRILTLEPMEGKKVRDAAGAVDQRLFNGENKLHATYSDTTGMWKLHYDVGSLPGGLKDQFTTFPDLLAHTKSYFKKRNVDVTNVFDA